MKVADREWLKARIAGQRAEQGLPPRIENEYALMRLAAILRDIAANHAGELRERREASA